VGVEGEGVIGALALADRVRPGAAASVRRLQEMGMRVVVLSGDRQPAVDAVAFELGLTGAGAVAVGGLLPDDKAAFIERLRAEANGAGVAMVGDGINDAPALVAADVGMAVSGGMEATAAAAGVVLLGEGPGGGKVRVPRAAASARPRTRSSSGATRSARSTEPGMGVWRITSWASRSPRGCCSLSTASA
jgi:cation transport ATPase